MPRFVILEHESATGHHFDLMLEEGETLLTWSFDAFPEAGMSCKSIFGHPLRFLDYEGELNSGRGTVTRMDSGRYDLLARLPESVHFTLRGGRLHGNYRLTKSTDEVWTLAEG